MSFDLPDLLTRRAAQTPHRLALREHGSDRALTFAGLEREAQQAAGLLAALGVAPQERFAVNCRNRIDFFVLLFAAAKLGAVMVPLNWRMPAAELAGLMAHCRPKAVFAGAEDYAATASAAEAQGLGAPVGLDLDYRERLAAAAPISGRARWPGAETWYLLYTSGTTGQPKAVIQTYQMAIVNYVNVRQATDLREGERTLNFLPLFHTAGINLHTLPALFAGGSSVITPGFDLAATLGLIESGAIDLFFAVPAVYQAIALAPEFSRLDLSRVRSWGCGGAPLPDALAQTFHGRGAMVCNGMGMTETGPTVFLQQPSECAAKIGSVGKPALLADVRLVGPDGRDVASGEAGEMWFGGPGVTPGYWEAPQATANAIAPGGWLKSGDLGRRDADGHYYVVGRLKEMYISGGENVYPAEVENVLALHPAILEAAVVGAPDTAWGEAGHAYLLLRPGAARPEIAELVAFCRDRLAGYKVPKRWVFAAELPRTAAGKVQKHRLSEVEPLS